MVSAYANVVVTAEVVFSIIGVVLLWTLVVSPRARRKAAQSPLPKWDAEPIEFALFLCLVLGGTFIFSIVAGLLVKQFSLSGDYAIIVGGAGAQFGLLAAVLTFASYAPKYRHQAQLGPWAIVLSGAATFVIALPLLEGTSRGWELLLRSAGIPVVQQDLIHMFANAKSRVFLTLLIALATIIAPVTEELVFRAGIFRFLRTRSPRFLAILIPAVIFASLHVNWSSKDLEGFASFAPLVVLAVLFSIAYERTGHIGTTIVAHALFNLNTIFVILSGAGAA